MFWLYFLILVVVVAAGLYCLSRLCAIVLSNLLSKISKKDISIDYVGFFSLKNISANLLDSSAHIDQIWISWKVFNANQRYPAVLHIGDITVRADVSNWENSNRQRTADKPSSGPQGSASGFSKRISAYAVSFLKTIIQLMSVHLEVVNFMLLNADGTDSLLHITINETEGFAQISDNRLISELKVTRTSLRIIKSAALDVKDSSNIVQASTSVSTTIEFDLLQKQLKVCSVHVGNPTVLVHDGFINSLAAHVNNRPVATKEKVIVTSSLSSENKALLLLQQHFPEEVKIHIEDLTLNLIAQATHRSLQLSTKQLNLTSQLKEDRQLINCTADKSISLLALTSELSLQGIDIVSSNSRKIFCLKKCDVGVDLSKDGLQTQVYLHSCHATYLDDEMQYWTHLAQGEPITELDESGDHFEDASTVFEDSGDGAGEEKKFQTLFKNWILPVTLEVTLEELSDTMSFKNAPPTSIQICSVKGEVNLVSNTKQQTQVFRSWLHVDGLLWKFGSAPCPGEDHLATSHYFGYPCILQTFDFRMEIHQKLVILDVTVQSLQLESSPELYLLCNYLVAMAAPFMKQKKKKKVEPKNKKKQQTPSKMIQFSIQMEEVYFYSISSIPGSLVFQFDSLVAETADLKFSAIVEGMHFFKFNKEEEMVPLHSLNTLEHVSLVDLREINVKYLSDANELECSIPDGLDASWDTTSHMTIFHHGQEVFRFVKDVAAHFAKSADVIETKSEKPTKVKELLRNMNITVSITIMKFVYQLSENKKNSISVHEGYLQKQGTSVLKASAPKIVFGFDGHNLFVMKSACIENLINNHHHLEERKSHENLKSPTNRGFGVYIKSLDINFPWQYDFAANYNEIININKWLKKLHITKKPGDKPVYPDLIIRCQTLTMKIHDDPFEVKLGDNYELMKDERNESRKRRELLNKKVEELKSTHGQLLPAKKVEELYTSLEKKSLEIFLKRSQRLYSTTPMRQALLTFIVTGLDINALADPSMNGKENVVKHMKEIDPHSPYPNPGPDYTTLWCRMVRGHIKSFDIKLRDYPQPLWEIRNMHWWGRLLGAEQEAKPRAKREQTIEVGEPWGNDTVIRSMPPLKFFHDFTTDITEMRQAWGPSMEPTWAQVNMCLNNLNKASVDPSHPLPFWDKIRILYHGRLTASISQLNMYWLGMKDPYNTTELLDWEWNDVFLDWTNSHFLIKCDLDIFVRTASKYDDVRLLHLPNLKLEFALEWLCAGDPNDHHSVMPCAPDKIPEYSSNQVHDSYAAFRSQNLNLKITMEARGHKKGDHPDRMPSCLFYSSTMRWLQNFQSRVLSNVTRPTRKGKLFNNTPSRKIQLSRHYKFVGLNVKFPTMQITYWASFAKRQGMELCMGKGNFKSRYSLKLDPIEDGLIHRLMANWSIVEMDCELINNEAFLYTTDSGEDIHIFSETVANKHHLASLARVVYCRHLKEEQPLEDSSPEDEEEEEESEPIINENHSEEDFVHRLIVYEFCGSWTRFNRDVFFSLYDSYNSAQTLKKNLSTEALKGIKVDKTSQQTKHGLQSTPNTPPVSQGTSSTGNTPSPMTRLQAGHGATMLHQLLAETSTKFMVFSEETANGNELLYGVKACTSTDVLQNNWRIEMVNSQIMLKGSDSSGYVLVTAANARLMQRSHWPSWRKNKLTSKTTWVGNLDGLQYFATVESPSNEGDVCWLPTSIIERNVQKSADIPDMVGSGESVGGVVSDTVGPSVETSRKSVQVQRIISRCSAQIYFALYGGDVDPAVTAQVVKSSDEQGGNENDEDFLDKEDAVDSLTLIYHDLDVCTNSVQYSMLMDILNNLLLYVEPKRKVATQRIQHMRFALQLSSIDDQKGPIMQLQNSLRNLISHFRQVEKDLYEAYWASAKAPNNQNLAHKTRNLEVQLHECKESIGNAAEDLRIMVSCFQEIQLQLALKRKLKNAQEIKLSRRVELCFGVAKWRLTEADGQLGNADMELRHFKYTRISRDDDSGDNIFELGYITIHNLLANDTYKDVLRPQDPTGSQAVLRVITRGRPPVGGISVHEKFELSVIPLSIQLTYRFFKKMMAFFFPRHNVDQEPPVDDSSRGADDDDSLSIRSGRSGTMRSTASDDSFGSSTLSSQGTTSNKSKRKQQKKTDDIDKMKERAARNNSFFYIKIPAVPLSVSYKGEKDKNIEDVHNFQLTLPSLEYHNCTWTWLDLLMAMKKEYKQAVLSQAIKEKLKFRIGHKDDGAVGMDTTEDVDKARLLMGEKATNIAREEKHSSRRTLFGKGHHQGGN